MIKYFLYLYVYVYLLKSKNDIDDLAYSINTLLIPPWLYWHLLRMYFNQTMS